MPVGPPPSWPRLPRPLFDCSQPRPLLACLGPRLMAPNHASPNRAVLGPVAANHSPPHTHSQHPRLPWGASAARRAAWPSDSLHNTRAPCHSPLVGPHTTPPDACQVLNHLAGCWWSASLRSATVRAAPPATHAGACCSSHTQRTHLAMGRCAQPAICDQHATPTPSTPPATSRDPSPHPTALAQRPAPPRLHAFRPQGSRMLRAR